MSRTRLAIGAFAAMFRRDLVVTSREFVRFLLQALVQPVFFLFIFGKILPSIGLTAGSFAFLMLPGIVALTGLLGALQGISFSLAFDLSFARQIDDRLLSPLPVWWVALEKVLYGASRSALAAVIVFPLGRLILGEGYAVRSDRIPEIAGMIVLTALAGATMGLVVGTVVKHEQVAILGTLIFTPLLFTGCTYYPWSGLNNIRWFQILTLFNPLTYCSEGLRHAMVPPIAGREFITLNIETASIALGLAVFVMFVLGTRTFSRRIVS
jgi:ABC-2 type transport system permease protein